MSNKAAMKQDAKPALTPKLRFPEFCHAPGWGWKPLDACLDYQQPTPYLVSATNYSPSFKTPVLTAGKTFVLGHTNEEHGIFSEGLPVVIFDDFTTATQFVDFPFKAKSSAMKILQAKNGANIKFMYETLQEISYEVGAHQRHWISKFAPMLALIPQPEEQQKIADCLTSLDEVIAAQRQKLNALKTHKKGLMQQLFPREGETLPRLRFPEFQDEPEWEEKRLGDVGSVRMCKRILKEQTSPRGDIPFYKIGTFGGVPDAYISRETFENFRSNFPFPKKGSVLISAAGTIGRTVLYTGELAYFQDSNIVWLDNNQNLIADNFLFYLYQLINWSPSVGAIQRLYNENILGAKVNFPSIPEQQKIAACLTSLDDLITTQSDKLEALKTHKKGLMQQLFPSPKEVEA